MGKSDSTSFSMKVLFLVLSGFAVFQAWAEEEASTSLGVVKDLLETLLTRVEHLENEVRTGAGSPGDDLEERLTKKIEDLGEKLHFEILNTARDVKDLLEDKMDDTKDEFDEIKVMKSVHCGFQDKVGDSYDTGLHGDTIVFDTIHTEINPAGSSLSASSGKFTAGKSGVYQVSVSASGAYTHDNTVLKVYLKTSAGKYQAEHQIAYQEFDSDSWGYTPLSSIRYIHLNQGETAYLQYSCDESHDKCRIYDLKFCISLYQ